MDLVFVGLCSSRVRSLVSSTGWWQRWHVSPYLVDAKTSIGARVRSVTSIGYVQILLVGVFYQRKQFVGFRYGDFDLFLCMLYCKVWYLQHSVPMVNDCKLAFLREFLQTMFFQ